MYVDFAAKKTDIYWQVCDQSCFAVAGGLVENRRSGFWCMNGCICLLRDSWDEGGDPCWPATCWDSSLDVGRQRIYKMYYKSTALLCGADMCMKSVAIERPRLVRSNRSWEGMCHLQYCHWIQFSEETPSCFTALLNDTAYADFNTKKENVLPWATSSPDESDTF